MRPKWIIGLAIGLLFLYVSYFGVAGIGLELFRSMSLPLYSGSSWILSEEDNMGGAGVHKSFWRFIVVMYSSTSVTYVIAVNDTGTWVDLGEMPETITFDNFLIDQPPLWVIKSNLSVGDKLQGSDGYTVTDTASRFYLGITYSTNHVHIAQGFDFYFEKYTGIMFEMRYASGGYYENFLITDVPTYTITASAGIGGSISPSGAVPVSLGLSQAFTISPNNGYTISSVLVDGSNQGAIASYTFTNVHAPHTISASFAQLPPEPTYNIIASAGAGGSISPSGTITVNAGASQTFTITSNTGYQISSVLIDGASTFFTVYTFTNVQASHTIAAFFSVLPPNQYTISASAGTGGSINPSGSVIVTVGASQSFTIASSAGYHISDVSVDGVSLSPPVLTYTFTNVQTSHTISASFSLNTPNQYTISASAGTGGSISPSGSVLVNQGLNQAFTITANNGYIISAVLVDGTSQGAVSTYTFTNVQTSHTISASFSVETGPTPNYFLLILLDLLGNSRLMLIVGASITSISAVMLFWPKHKPQYY